MAFSPGMGLDMVIALLSIPLMAANWRLGRATPAHMRAERSWKQYASGYS
jgi:hypothetical protein